MLRQTLSIVCQTTSVSTPESPTPTIPLIFHLSATPHVSLSHAPPGPPRLAASDISGPANFSLCRQTARRRHLPGRLCGTGSRFAWFPAIPQMLQVQSTVRRHKRSEIGFFRFHQSRAILGKERP